MKFLIAILFLVPQFAFGADIDVSNAEHTAVNQCYIDQEDGTWVSVDGNYQMLNIADIYCSLREVVTDFDPGQYYYFVGSPCTESDILGSSGLWTEDTWEAGSPDFTTNTGGCDIPPPPTPTSTASTTELTQLHYDALWFLWFIVFACSFLWFERYYKT